MSETKTAGGEVLYTSTLDTDESAMLEKIYKFSDDMATTKEHAQFEAGFKSLLESSTGSTRVKTLIATLLPKYAHHFPSLATEATDTMIALCNDEESMVKLSAFKSLLTVCKDSAGKPIPDSVNKVTDYLVQALTTKGTDKETEHRRHLLTSFDAIAKLSVKDVCDRLLIFMEAPEGEEHDALRETAGKLLKENICAKSSELLHPNEEAQDFLKDRIAKVLELASEVEFKLLVDVLKGLKVFEVGQKYGPQGLANVIADQADLPEALEPAAVEDLQRVLECVNIALPFLKKGAVDKKMTLTIVQKILPAFSKLEPPHQLLVLQRLCELSPFISRQSARSSIPTIFSLLMENLVDAPAATATENGQEAAPSTAEEEPSEAANEAAPAAEATEAAEAADGGEAAVEPSSPITTEPAAAEASQSAEEPPAEDATTSPTEEPKAEPSVESTPAEGTPAETTETSPETAEAAAPEAASAVEAAPEAPSATEGTAEQPAQEDAAMEEGSPAAEASTAEDASAAVAEAAPEESATEEAQPMDQDPSPAPAPVETGLPEIAFTFLEALLFLLHQYGLKDPDQVTFTSGIALSTKVPADAEKYQAFKEKLLYTYEVCDQVARKLQPYIPKAKTAKSPEELEKKRVLEQGMVSIKNITDMCRPLATAKPSCLKSLPSGRLSWQPAIVKVPVTPMPREPLKRPAGGPAPGAKVLKKPIPATYVPPSRRGQFGK